LNCDNVKNKIYAYIDGLISGNEKDDLLAHISTCPQCKEEYEKTIDMINALQSCADNMPCANIDLNEIKYKSNLSLEVNMKKKRNYLNKNIIKKAISYAAVFFIGVFFYAAATGNLFGDYSTENADLYGASDSVYQSEEARNSLAKDKDAAAEVDSTRSGDKALNDFEMSLDKIIYYSSFVIEVNNYEAARESIFKIVEENNAFIQNEDKSISGYGDNEYYTSNFIIRVPHEKFDHFNALLEKLGKVRYSSSNAINITYEYNDTTASLEQLKVQKNRLLELYKKADKISELIEIENELARINSLIEQSENIIKNYDRQIQYSQINVSISEDVSKNSLINPFTNIGQKIKSAFVNSINLFLKLFANLLVLLVKIIPFAFAAAIIYFIVKSILKRKKRNIDIIRQTEKNDKDNNVDKNI